MEQWSVKQQRTNTNVTVSVRQLELKDLAAIQTCQQEIVEALDDASRLQPLSKPEMVRILSGDGRMLGVWKGDALIAFRTTFIPGADDPENLGFDLGFSRELRARIAHLELTCVHPDYRGNGLQQKLGRMMIEQDSEWIFTATVHPGNIPSLKDKFALGLQLVLFKEKYEGQPRYLFCSPYTTRGGEDDSIATSLQDPGIPSLLKQGYVATALYDNQLHWKKQKD